MSASLVRLRLFSCFLVLFRLWAKYLKNEPIFIQALINCKMSENFQNNGRWLGIE